LKKYFQRFEQDLSLKSALSEILCKWLIVSSCFFIHTPSGGGAL